MKPSLWDYVREAFNAKPIGMFLPPNWAMLAGFGLAGYLHDPGWLVLGTGVELGYLLLLGTNARFQRFVAGKLSAGGSREVEQRWQTLVGVPPRHRQTPLRRARAALPGGARAAVPRRRDRRRGSRRRATASAS